MLKSLFQRTMPRTYAVAQEKWRRLQVRRFERQMERLSKALVERYGRVVMDGPFAGMVYAPQAVCSALIPKLLGSYEAELHGVLARAMAAGYPVIVDIGCAEGYYAVGMALRVPRARVYAFDSDPLARQLCADMARANGVADRLRIGGACDIEQLRVLPLEQALIICDCEGYELELLRPDLIAGLRHSDVLVELHDCYDPRISPTILQRFAPTHDSTLITSTDRDPAQYPHIAFLPTKDRKVAVDELRLPTKWAFMTTRGKHWSE